MKLANILKIILLAGIVMGTFLAYYAGYERGKRESLSLIPPQIQTPSAAPQMNLPPASTPTPTTTPGIDVSDWKTYRNDKYGFELTFPSSWKGYIVETGELELGNIGKYDSINFGFNVQKSLFNINVFTKDQWEKLVSSEINNGRPKPDYINKNGKFFFSVAAAQYTENQEMSDRMNEIGNILSTFKFIEK